MVFVFSIFYFKIIKQKEGIDILNAEYYSKITIDQLKYIFRPAENSSELPMLNERLNILHEIGPILLKVN